MLKRFFQGRPAKTAGRNLYVAAVDQARRPFLYTNLGVEDRIDARFELYVLHVTLLLERLKGHGEQAQEVSQAMFTEFVEALDDALRELGVGDLAVAKKMRKLGEAVFGRIKAFDEAVAGENPREALAGLVARSVFNDAEALERAGPLTDYLLDARARLAAQPLSEVIEARLNWPRTA